MSRIDEAIRAATDDAMKRMGLPQYGPHRKVTEASVRRAFEVGFRELGVEADESAEPGRMHPVDRAFYEQAVAERNRAWRTIDAMRNVLGD